MGVIGNLATAVRGNAFSIGKNYGSGGATGVSVLYTCPSNKRARVKVNSVTSGLNTVDNSADQYIWIGLISGGRNNIIFPNGSTIGTEGVPLSIIKNYHLNISTSINLSISTGAVPIDGSDIEFYLYPGQFIGQYNVNSGSAMGYDITVFEEEITNT